MKVAMVDPSLFTIPYDRALVEGLRANGHLVRWFGRPLRGWERETGACASVEEFFYARTEAARQSVGAGLGVWLKAVGHVASLFAFAREMRRWKPDVIHFQWFPAPAVDRAFLPRLGRLAPVVATVHDSRPFNANPSSRLQRLGARGVLRSCARLIVHTDGALEKVVAWGADRSRVSKVSHGLLGGAATGRRGGGGGKTVLVQFGTVKPYKGVDVLLRAVGLLPAPVRDAVRVVVAGMPSCDVRPLVALRRELGLEETVELDFRAYSEAEMVELFERADAMLYPYREIEASGVLLSSLPYGGAVIASRLGVFEEMLTDGVHGRLLPPGDAAALSAAIAEAAADPVALAARGRRAAELAAQIPSWEEIGRQTAAVYDAARREGLPS